MTRSIMALAILTVPLFIAAPIASVQPVGAQNLICQIFPFLQGIRFTGGLCGTGTGGDASDAVTTIKDLVTFGVSLIFVGIIAIAIFVIIKAALKYIQSEGDETKVEEATKAIKNVFIGIGALIIGIIGLVIILAVAQGSSTVNPLQPADNPLDEIIP